MAKLPTMTAVRAQLLTSQSVFSVMVRLAGVGPGGPCHPAGGLPGSSGDVGCDDISRMPVQRGAGPVISRLSCGSAYHDALGVVSGALV